VPATLDDVRAAVDMLADLAPDHGLDLSRVVAIGHSAGGHLAAWLALRDRPRVAITGMVAQAGVLDLARARALRLSDGVVDRFLAGHPTNVASPIELLPLRVPALLTHGARDDIVPLEISERFAKASGATLHVEPEGDHFGHIDPNDPLWHAVVRWLRGT
jgi:pimeloyl-ACP methyl ester carboxylesterase